MQSKALFNGHNLCPHHQSCQENTSSQIPNRHHCHLPAGNVQEPLHLHNTRSTRTRMEAGGLTQTTNLQSPQTITPPTISAHTVHFWHHPGHITWKLGMHWRVGEEKQDKKTRDSRQLSWQSQPLTHTAEKLQPSKVIDKHTKRKRGEKTRYKSKLGPKCAKIIRFAPAPHRLKINDCSPSSIITLI